MSDLEDFTSIINADLYCRVAERQAVIEWVGKVSEWDREGDDSGEWKMKCAC